jgi:hypothetical protein
MLIVHIIQIYRHEMVQSARFLISMVLIGVDCGGPPIFGTSPTTDFPLLTDLRLHN